MPTYQNSNFVLNLTYTSTQPTATAVYTDTAGSSFYILQVVGTGSTIAQFFVAGWKTPVIGTLTKVSGTGDSTVVLNSFTNQPPLTVGDIRVDPGQVAQTLEWVPSANLPSGLIQQLATPYLDNVILSSQLTSTGTVTVPSTVIDSSSGNTIALLGNYKIRIYGASGTGSATIQLNNANAVARYLGLYEEIELGCRQRTINTIIVTITSTFTVNVSIEKI